MDNTNEQLPLPGLGVIPFPVENKKEVKLMMAALVDSSITNVGNVWSSSLVPDKMDVPTDYLRQVTMCRFFYSRDPVVSGAINKQIEIAFNDLKPRRNDCTDEEYKVYTASKDILLEALKASGLEFLVSGLIVPEIAWKSVTGGDLGLKNRKNRRYEVPDYVWLRPIENLILKPSPIPVKVRVFVKVSREDAHFIISKGVYVDGTRDTELYEQMLRDYPEYVKMVTEGKLEMELPNHFIIRRKIQPNNIYPTPYLLPALESLVHKRNLKKMDYSIASRVISAIQLIRLGDKDYPLTEDDKDSMEELKSQMRWRAQPNNVERVFQLFGNHTLQIDWIYPDTKALLDDTKYNSVNADILHALGLPNIITVGETGKSATSQAEYALLPPAETLKSLRNDLLPFMMYIFNEIKSRNNFENMAFPALAPIRLYDPEKISKVGELLYNNGALSKTTWADVSGFDLDNELVLRKSDDKRTKELGLEPTPQVPFSSPSIGGGSPKTSKTPAKSNESN